MALQSRQLWNKVTRAGHPRIEPEDVARVKFSTSAGAELLPVGMPLVYASGEWAPWQTADGSVIDGFVYPAAVQLSATEEVLGVVMTSGQIHYDEITTYDNIPGTAGETELLAAIRDNGTVNRKLRIDGLSEVR